MTDGLATSLENLYQGNITICAKQGVSREVCEKRIETILKVIQKRTEKVCGKIPECNEQGMEYIIDTEEIEKLKQKLLLTYT